jgi:hypothetical protein
MSHDRNIGPATAHVKLFEICLVCTHKGHTVYAMNQKHMCKKVWHAVGLAYPPPNCLQVGDGNWNPLAHRKLTLTVTGH